jgi:hypothetical protein
VLLTDAELDHTLGLLLLRRCILIGVAVNEVLLVKAQFSQAILEVGQILRFIARGLRLGEQKRDPALRSTGEWLCRHWGTASPRVASE